MQKSTILITGADGQLAKSIAQIAHDYPSLEFVFLNRAALPLGNAEDVENVFSTFHPDFCINCTAYTAVDKAETDKETAFLVNATAVESLAAACLRWQIKFIHISTDYVFNGSSAISYKESDTVDPINVYGASKAEGERLAFNCNPETIVIRTSWLYSEHGNNFVKTMLRLMKERPDLNIVDDQTGAPTYAPDLADAILKVVTHSKWLPGIYHYCNVGRITWYEFARAIKTLVGAPCALVPVPATSYPTPARRPMYSLLDTTKIKENFNLKIPFWEDSLRKCIGILQKG